MKPLFRSGLPAAAFLAAAALSPAIAAGESKGRPWTIEDILTVPEVNEIALAHDGKRAIYAVDIADIAAGRPRSHVRTVDVATGRTRTILTVEAAKSLRPIPGTPDWSALLDFGDGLQLYRMDNEGAVRPLIVNPSPVPVGKADMSFPIGGGMRPSRIGVLDYDWSPDGKWLWYSLIKAKPGAGRVRFDDEVSALRNRRRSAIEVEVDYLLRGPDGAAVRIATRPSTDRVATRGGGRIVWQNDEVRFRVEVQDGTLGGKFELWAWDRTKQAISKLASQRDLLSMWILVGPHGGQLATTGVDKKLELVETSSDGRRHSYGPVAFEIGDPRAAGWKMSADGRRVVLGTRGTEDLRYGLAVLERNAVRVIDTGASLTRCGFDGALATAVCVEEGMTIPPRLIHIDLRTGAARRLDSISSRHDAIEPLRVIPRSFVSRDGYRAQGYVVLPRGYREGERYPALVVTHGSDADERFSEPGNQWNYPVQLFAERGYVVLLLNDPSPRQSDELMDAYRAWMRGKGPPDPDTVRQRIWLNGIHSIEDAVKDLSTEGLIDPNRLGIAGYSRGSQMVNVAITNSRLFRAASSGDGGFLEPSGYAGARASYDPVYGGGPLGDNIDHYRRFAPSLNARKICAAVLQQVASASPSQIELFEALRDADVPTQLSYYPGTSPASDETHVFHIPSNRLQAMRENLAWFDYWLLGVRDPDALFAGRVANWDRLANGQRDRCVLTPRQNAQSSSPIPAKIR
ncbi:MAG TPA: prolyl oligopeptidase family serine peptidase [Sphingopyxis sp.]|uniref:prolyl oligopeptidase family serine peptidase n=1 Tax=Sphingopyxis sp. TaxID=1908224 RepID=UPI002E3167E6|nr:prolyl oligopeptidase family serine peptidase [Sphingopyxis sp.]HEX2813698.1 prolyl oligopeptidase family serine peptidase [Sphingopyxis sp.]